VVNEEKKKEKKKKKKGIYGAAAKLKDYCYMNCYGTFDLRLFGVVRGNKMKNYVCVT
jgi:hypothetical protein